MKRTLIALTSHAAHGDTGQTTGNYLSELTHSYFVFEQAGYPIELASIQGGEPPAVEASIKLDDPYNKRFYERADIVAALRNTPRIADLRATDYQAIFFVGEAWNHVGFSAQWGVARPDSAIYEQGGVVSAVGHGSAALVNIRLEDGRFLVEGHEVTSVTNEEEQAEKTVHIVPFSLEDKLAERGGRFKKAHKMQTNVVSSGRMVTGQNPASAMGTAEVVVALLAVQNDGALCLD
jgi:putative intracellular protease/amidase